MSTLRKYINTQRFQNQQNNKHIKYPRYKTDILQSSKKKKNYTQINYSQPKLQIKKMSLPPIQQNPSSSRIFNLQIQRSQVINKYFQNKNKEIISPSHTKSLSNKSSSLSPVHKKQPIKTKSRLKVSLQEIRMRPVSKYFYKMQNIRLAERLLLAKPSPQINRKNQKKFYLQQKNYSNQISYKYRSLSQRNKKPSISYQNKRWNNHIQHLKLQKILQIDTSKFQQSLPHSSRSRISLFSNTNLGYNQKINTNILQSSIEQSRSIINQKDKRIKQLQDQIIQKKIKNDLIEKAFFVRQTSQQNKKFIINRIFKLLSHSIMIAKTNKKLSRIFVKNLIQGMIGGKKKLLKIMLTWIISLINILFKFLSGISIHH